MSNILPDILAIIGLALLGYGLFLLFGLGWCCVSVGGIMLAGGVFLSIPSPRKMEGEA